MSKERNHSVVFLGSQLTNIELISSLEAAGLNIRCVDTLAELPSVLGDGRPGSLVVDMADSGDELKFLDDLRDVLKGAGASRQLIILSERADQEIRLRAVQTGSHVFLTRPVSRGLLVQYLEPARQAWSDDYRVLMIGDSRDMLADVDTGLQQAGMSIRRLRNPAQALLSLINISPDILIIEHPLTGIRGDHLGRMVHQLTDCEDMPVIYVCPEGSDDHPELYDVALASIVTTSVTAQDLALLINRLVRVSRERRARLEYLRNCDQTTGLFNRNGFLDFLERGIQVNNVTALILCELENLQHHYQDLAPRQIDELMSLVAGLLDRFTASSLMDARIGDYVFAFLVEAESAKEIRKLGQLISHIISSRVFEIGQHPVTVACNVGIAVTLYPLDDGGSLFALAVKACEEARIAGVNRISIRTLDPADNLQKPLAHRALVRQLHEALDENRFRLVYQPIASMRGDSVEKYEVLLRMYDHDGDEISPLRFVPVAEKSGLMTAVDRWVVVHALETLRKEGKAITLFLKISPITMQDPEFPGWLRGSLADYGMDGERLVFDVRESDFSSSAGSVSEFCRQVKELGCRLALDHHNVSQELDRFMGLIPASFVKIDGHSINDIAYNPDRQKQLRSAIELAEVRGARVIAGFIEDVGSLQLLWQSGVHYIQGNFLQPPDEALDFDFGSEAS